MNKRNISINTKVTIRTNKRYIDMAKELAKEQGISLGKELARCIIIGRKFYLGKLELNEPMMQSLNDLKSNQQDMSESFRSMRDDLDSRLNQISRVIHGPSSYSHD